MKKLLSILIVPLFIIFFMEVFCLMGHTSPGMMGYTGGGVACTSNCPHTIDLSPAANADEYSIYYNGSAWASFDVSNGLESGDLNAFSRTKTGSDTLYKNANIPSNATITVAYKTDKCNGSTTGTIYSYITGQKSATPAAIASVSDYKTIRGTIVGGANNNNITTTQVSWSLVNPVNGTSYQSPSLVGLIQEIVNLGSTVTDIRLFTDDHNGRTASNVLFAWYSYSQSSSNKSVLHIEYTTP